MFKRDDALAATGFSCTANPVDRPSSLSNGETTLVSSPDRPCYLLVPIIHPDHFPRCDALPMR